MLIVGYADGNLLVEPARAPQPNVQRVGLIRGADDHYGHIGIDGQIVEARQQLRDNAVLHILGGRLSSLRDRFDFVYEQNARCVCLLFIK